MARRTLQLTPTAKAKHTELKMAAKSAKESREKEGRTASSPQEGLFEQVQKCLKLLAENPRHTGLQTHEYDAIKNPVRTGEKVFEAYAQNRTPGAYRVFWCYGPTDNDLTIIAITPHP